MEETVMMEEENNKNNNPTGSLPTKRISLVKITVLSISKNKALIESFIEDVLNRHDLSAIEKYSIPIAAKRGGSFKQFLSAFFTAFPDWHTNIEHVVAEDNLVVVFLNQTGTH
jgi:predicted ester cyclase